MADIVVLVLIPLLVDIGRMYLWQDVPEQIKITQVDSQYTWVSTCERRPSARTRCSAGGPMRFVHLPGSGSEYCLVLHPVESSPEPCVSRFSHMVDVHPPDFFALGLSLKTPTP